MPWHDLAHACHPTMAMQAIAILPLSKGAGEEITGAHLQGDDAPARRCTVDA